MIKMFLSSAGRLWCTVMHPSPMWPMHGCYLCPRCLREYPVPWACGEGVPAGPSPAVSGPRSAVVEVSSFGAPRAAYAGHGRRNW